MSLVFFISIKLFALAENAYEPDKKTLYLELKERFNSEIIFSKESFISGEKLYILLRKTLSCFKKIFDILICAPSCFYSFIFL